MIPNQNRMEASAARSQAWRLRLFCWWRGLWLAHELTAASKMQDCLMTGRTNCNVIEPPAR